MTDVSQRIARLTPVAEVMARIDATKPVPDRAVETGAALGRILARDVMAPADSPSVAVALRDGFAVRAEQTKGASAQAPVGLPQIPQRIDTGDPLPGGTDAIMRFDAIEGDRALATAAPGDGVLAPGGDAKEGQPLRRAGQRLRVSDLAIMATLRIPELHIREPRIWLVRAATSAGASTALIGAQLTAEGADVFSDDDLQAALDDDSADAIIGVGGTGSGTQDEAVNTLARHGEVFCHGIGLMPGGTAAYGMAHGRPVLLLPGRIDSALASWLVLGKRLIARLNGRSDDEPALTATLLRAVTSAIGIADVVPVRRNGNAVEPLASGDLPLTVLTRADGWILVPTDKDGYPSGATVTVRPLT